jgi:hypothetical protein
MRTEASGGRDLPGQSCRQESDGEIQDMRDNLASATARRGRTGGARKAATTPLRLVVISAAAAERRGLLRSPPGWNRAFEQRDDILHQRYAHALTRITTQLRRRAALVAKVSARSNYRCIESS